MGLYFVLYSAARACIAWHERAIIGADLFYNRSNPSLPIRQKTIAFGTASRGKERSINWLAIFAWLFLPKLQCKGTTKRTNLQTIAPQKSIQKRLITPYSPPTKRLAGTKKCEVFRKEEDSQQEELFRHKKPSISPLVFFDKLPPKP